MDWFLYDRGHRHVKVNLRNGNPISDQCFRSILPKNIRDFWLLSEGIEREHKAEINEINKKYQIIN